MKFNNLGVYISPKATIGKNVKIGDRTLIYDHVTIGDNSIIGNDCVIGEPTNGYYFNDNYENAPTIIGENALIRSHAIIYTDVQIGPNLTTGHRVTIREKTKMGRDCSVGTLCDLQGYQTIGDYCRLHSNVNVGQQCTIGNFVFIYSYAMLTNDPHPPSNICQGATIGDFTQIGVHAIILPQIMLGKHCLVGARATVTRDFEDGSLIIGTPARRVGSVGSVKSREKAGISHYPWPNNFERNMPWEGIGYAAWASANGMTPLNAAIFE